jgi:hypothetical protein
MPLQPMEALKPDGAAPPGLLVADFDQEQGVVCATDEEPLAVLDIDGAERASIVTAGGGFSAPAEIVDHFEARGFEARAGEARANRFYRGAQGDPRRRADPGGRRGGEKGQTGQHEEGGAHVVGRTLAGDRCRRQQ